GTHAAIALRQCPACEVDQVLAARRAVQRTAAGGHHARQARVPAVTGGPVQPVAPAVFAARSQGGGRTPESDDVVGVLVGGGDLDQVDLTLAPGVERLDPAAGALFVAGLEVLVVLEAALALHQAEAARIVILEAAVLDRARI